MYIDATAAMMSGMDADGMDFEATVDGGLSLPVADAGEPAQGGEAVLGARPVPARRADTRSADHRAQHRGDDDRVIGVSDDRDEICRDGSSRTSTRS
jgi:hypothetical protein